MIVRRGKTFETNSSSTHNFAIITENDYITWNNEFYYLHIDDIESRGCLNFNEDVPSNGRKMEQLLPYRLEGKYLYTPMEMKEYIIDKQTNSSRYDENRESYARIIACLDNAIAGKISYADYELVTLLMPLNFFIPSSLKNKEIHNGIPDIDVVEEHENGMVLLGYYGDV